MAGDASTEAASSTVGARGRFLEWPRPGSPFKGIERNGATPKVGEATPTSRKGSGYACTDIPARARARCGSNHRVHCGRGRLQGLGFELLIAGARAAVQALARPGELLPRPGRLVRE